MKLNTEQIASLEKLMNGDNPQYTRLKALALLAVYRGQRTKDVAEIVEVTSQTINNWRLCFLNGGMDSLCKSNGSGRLSDVDPAQIEEYLTQSPKNLGLHNSRWSLASLAKVVPCLEGYSRYGVQLVLERLGYYFEGVWKKT